MDEKLVEDVLGRLAAAETLASPAADLVLAALQGEDELAACLDGAALPAPQQKEAPPAHVGAYVSSINVSGFRGVGPTAPLKLEPGPGLTLVVGRNGSGKSSFAEGLEVLLTGENRRWSDRSSVWRDGWRNLHVSEPCRVEAELCVDGQRGVTRVQRSWLPGTEITGGQATSQRHGAKVQSLSELGWDQDVVTFRPFLSYNELGSMLDEGPSKLFDALSSILGLEQLVATEKSLRDARQERDRLRKATRETASRLREALSEVNDERADACADALVGSDWDLDALERAVSGELEVEGNDGNMLGLLDALARIQGPAPAEVFRVAGELQAAAAAVAAITGTDADRSHQTAALLEAALQFHQDHGDAECAVCRTGTLDANWRSASESLVERLRAEAEVADRAHHLARTARDEAYALIGPLPDELRRADRADIDGTAALAMWTEWAEAPPPDDLELVAAHLERTGPPLAAALAGVREIARAKHKELEDRWRPLAEALRDWLPRARQVRADAEAIPALKAAEDWVKAVAGDMRQARFAPLADEAQEIWMLLRQQSSVSLDRVRLEGTATRRRVELDVTVDGVAGAALGVMSQGELHALALSLFLPRATMDESPFRFLIIDDPVQSMDPARVEGLALALQRAAGDRQVIVFTHDDRLPEAARRLGVDARVIEVTRRGGSVVETRVALDPVDRVLADARAVSHTPELPNEVATAVVPGLCRLALEALFVQMTRRRRLAAGDAHVDVEAMIGRVDGLTKRAALALFDDEVRGGDVYTYLNDHHGRWAGDVVRACGKGAHGSYNGNVRTLVGNTEKLVAELRRS